MTGKFDRSQKEPAEGTRVHYSTVKNRSALQSHPDWKTFADNEQVNYHCHNNRNHVEKKSQSSSVLHEKLFCDTDLLGSSKVVNRYRD